ncbi:MAG: ribonuclease P protein component [Candidatus Woesebacteria bacterium]
MLPGEYRLKLRTQKDFFGTPNRVWSANVLWFIQKNVSGVSQAAVIIPKALETRATRRNALKRQFQKALLPCLESNPGFAIVGVLKKKRTIRLDPYEDTRYLDHHLHTGV